MKGIGLLILDSLHLFVGVVMDLIEEIAGKETVSAQRTKQRRHYGALRRR